MAYKTAVTIPYMTDEMREEIYAIVPGVRYMNVPIIDTEAAAIEEATEKLQPELDRTSQSEYIAGVQSVTLDTVKNMYTVTFNIQGD